ncbi:MAG: hypothetical protein MI919_13810, partial [Holophagales bacterium]|nr:hypothetical protein [Holophagales bacterium]
AVARDHEATELEVVRSVAGRVLWWDLEVPDGGGEGQESGVSSSVVAVDALPRLARALGLGPGELRLRALDASGDPGSGEHGGAEEAFERLDALRQRETIAAGSAVAPAEDGGESRVERLAGVLGEWLRFVGPLPVLALAREWGLGAEALESAVERLVSERRAVVDELVEGSAGAEVCDAENLEILLRWLRSDRRPVFEPRGAEELPLFLALEQGLIPRGAGLEALQERLERLFGRVLPAGLWESDVLPARLDPYYPSWLDSAMQQSELIWVGHGKEKLTFAFEGDLELLVEAGEPASDPAGEAGKGRGAEENGDADRDGEAALELLLPEGAGALEPEAIAASTGLAAGDVYERLWRLAWEGRATCESWPAVRQALGRKLAPPEGAPAEGGRRPRWSSRRGGWKSSRASGGRWRRLRAVEEPDSAGDPVAMGALDAVDDLELVKDRVRLLLGRYGVLFRELLERELPALRWGAVFRTARLMELSG